MLDARQLCAVAVFVAACTGAGAAVAQAVVSTGESFLSARLLPGVAEAGGARMAGLRLRLADGWKTYWRSPGEAGVPPVFDWSRSRNLRHAELFWPRPEMFESFGLRAIGYSEEIVLPVRLVAEDPARPIEARLKADLGVCREICVLESVELDETIHPGEAPRGAAEIARAMASVPVEGAASGMEMADCRISGAGDERRLEATLRFSRPLRAPTVLVEGPESLWISDAVTLHEGDELRVLADISTAGGGGWLDRSAVRMTVLDEDFAADIRGCTRTPG